jgi:conjugal transfer mating pair stabilization protein TraG
MWRRLKRKKNVRALAVAGLCLVATLMIYTYNMPPHIEPAAYTPLLNTIAKGESKGNYNAYYGNVSNTALRFTDMTIEEVLQWQEDYVHQGSPSSAVGKYQLIRPTLAGLVRQLKIEPQAKFDEALQDRMAIALLERRGALDYAAKKLSREAFAANLAKEWAALPRVVGGNPEESYYAHDGINRSHITIDEVFKALASLEG